jgi:hypothetical protein
MPLPASRRQCADGAAPRRHWSGFSQCLGRSSTPSTQPDMIGPTSSCWPSSGSSRRGHQLAGRVVLQALLPKLAKTATHAGGMCTSSSDTWAEDRRHITIAEFWDVMADYPVAPPDQLGRLQPRAGHPSSHHRGQKATHGPAGRSSRLPRRRDPRRCSTGTWLAGLSTTDSDPVEEITQDSDLLEVIAWGLRNATISQDEAQLLVASYLPERTTGFGFATVAEQLGLTQAAVRQRCSRASRKLTEAVRIELRTPALVEIADQNLVA